MATARLVKKGTSSFQKEQKERVRKKRELDTARIEARQIRRRGGSATAQVIRGKAVVIEVRKPDVFEARTSSGTVVAKGSRADITRQLSLQAQKEARLRAITQETQKAEASKRRLKTGLTLVSGVPSGTILQTQVAKTREKVKVPIPQRQLEGIVVQDVVNIRPISLRQINFEKLNQDQVDKMLDFKRKVIDPAKKRIDKRNSKIEKKIEDFKFGIDKIPGIQGDSFTKQTARAVLSQLTASFDAFVIGNTLSNAVDQAQVLLRQNLDPEIRKAMETYTNKTLNERSKIALEEARVEFRNSFNPKTPEGLANIIVTTGIILTAGVRSVPKKVVVTQVSKASGVKPSVISSMISKVQTSLKGNKFVSAIIKTKVGRSNISRLKNTISKLKKAKKVLVKERKTQVKKATKKAKKLVSGKRIAAERRKSASIKQRLADKELKALRRAAKPESALSIERSVQRIIKEIGRELKQKELLKKSELNTLKRLEKTSLRADKLTNKKIVEGIKKRAKDAKLAEKKLNKFLKERVKSIQKARDILPEKELRRILKEQRKVNGFLAKTKRELTILRADLTKVLRDIKNSFGSKVQSVYNKFLRDPVLNVYNSLLKEIQKIKNRIDGVVKRVKERRAGKKIAKAIGRRTKIRARRTKKSLREAEKKGRKAERVKGKEIARAIKKRAKLRELKKKQIKKKIMNIDKEVARDIRMARKSQSDRIRQPFEDLLKQEIKTRRSKTFAQYRANSKVLANKYVSTIKNFSKFYKDLLKSKVVRRSELLRRKIKNLNPLKKSDFDIGLERSLKNLDKQLKVKKAQSAASKKAIKGAKSQREALNKVDKLQKEINDLEFQIAEGQRLEKLADVLWQEYSKSLKSSKDIKKTYFRDLEISNNIKNRIINRIFSGERKPQKIKKIIKPKPSEKKFNEVLTGESSVTILEVPESVSVNPTPIIEGGSRIPGVNRGGLAGAFAGIRFPNGVDFIGGSVPKIIIDRKPIDKWKPTIDISRKPISEPIRKTSPKRSTKRKVERKSVQKPKEKQILRQRSVQRTRPIKVQRVKRRIPKLLKLPKIKKSKRIRKEIDKIRSVIPSQFRPTLEAIFFEIVDTEEPEKITGLEIRAIITKLTKKNMRKKKNGKSIRNKKKLSKKTSGKRKKTTKTRRK